VILRDLVGIAGAEHMHACWLNPLKDQQPVYIPELSLSHHARQGETGRRFGGGYIGEVLSRGTTAYRQSQIINRTIDGIHQQLSRFRPDLILAVLDSPLCVRVMHRLLPELPTPLRTIVWDDVHTFCPAGQLDRWTRSGICREFGEVLQKSEQIAVICENMQRAYQTEYGVNSFVLRHGMPEAKAPLAEHKTTHGPLRLGFAGSITTPDCIQSLIAALDSLQWRIGDRDISLRMLGCRFQLWSRNRQNIEYLGWRDASETRDLLSECDALYLPQSFKPELRHLSELSFPTKLSTYVAARQPILLHAPDYGSLSTFWQQYALGPRVGNLQSTDVMTALQQSLQPAPQHRETWLHSAQQAHQQALSVELFTQGVRRLLG
jgi:uncharacterized protein Usg